MLGFGIDHTLIQVEKWSPWQLEVVPRQQLLFPEREAEWSVGWTVWRTYSIRLCGFSFIQVVDIRAGISGSTGLVGFSFRGFSFSPDGFFRSEPKQSLKTVATSCQQKLEAKGNGCSSQWTSSNLQYHQLARTGASHNSSGQREELGHTPLRP